MDGAPHTDPADPGGTTQWGISMRSHPEVAHKLRSHTLQLRTAVEIAREHYLHKIPTVTDLVSMPDSIAFVLFDDKFHGRNREMCGIIQKYINMTKNLSLKVDGYIGPVTAEHLKRMKMNEVSGLLVLLNATAPQYAASKAKKVMTYQANNGLSQYDYTDGFLHRYRWRVAKATALLDGN